MDIHVLIVDNHDAVRAGIEALLSAEPDIIVVGEAGDSDTAVSLTQAYHPDVILMDIVALHPHGVNTIALVKHTHWPGVILVHTAVLSETLLFQAVQAGAVVITPKTPPLDRLLTAIRDAFNGRHTLEPFIARRLLDHIQAPPSLPPTTAPLTPDEAEIIKLFAGERPLPHIATQLNLEKTAVHTHVGQILNKLHHAHHTQTALHIAPGA
ncbi:MAG: response regulator transcription factor [Anaerolineales bacterium]|nr:response regulator transcription factor [Anaerolineales bacterium]